MSGLLLLILAGALAAFFVIPGAARPRVGEGDVVLHVEEDGSVLLTWPEGKNVSVSRVSLRPGNEKEFQELGDYGGNTALLEGTLLRRPLTIRIQAVGRGKNLLGMERELRSRDSLEVTVEPVSAGRPQLAGEPGQAGELCLTWSGGGLCEVCTVENQVCRPVCQVRGGTASLRFGEGGDLELPSYDEPWMLTVRAVSAGDGYVLYGPCAQPIAARRENLLGNTLSLECQTTGERTYVLRWNETKGDFYEVREWSAAKGRWEVLTQVERTEPLRYETGLLRSGSDHRYQVAAIGGQEEEPVAPAELFFRADISPRYATVWPVVDVAFCTDAALSKSAGKVPAGTALCVLEEGTDCFQVRWKDQYGYVDSRFCMINLPEYVGDVCAYDITNSYSSIFKVHDVPIQNVTEAVVQGFEGISTAEDGFLVPYLYPSAKKLLTAAQAAERDGYRLRIYEAFRPNEATRFLYDTTLLQLDYPIPVLDEETGEYVFYEPPEKPEEPLLPEDRTEGEPAEPMEGDGQEGETDEGESETEPSEADQETEEPAPASEPEAPGEEPEPGLPEEGGLVELPQPEEEGEPAEPEAPTYRMIMTDGRFGINSFLAASVSAHNRGIALDLTIERQDGTPLEMQSAMHDLSWYSAAYLNNANAKLLESYMTMPGVGMRGLTSEWWHFQDDETRASIGLTSYLYKGVTAQGWTRDDVGWRYRAADGSYCRNTALTVDGVRYEFDAEGYVTE